MSLTYWLILTGFCKEDASLIVRLQKSRMANYLVFDNFKNLRVCSHTELEENFSDKD